MFALHELICLFVVFTSSMVFLSKNAVHSILFLILCFCFSGIVLFIFHIEFLGVIFIIVYIGAIAILFLFVIMMLNLKSHKTFNLLNNIGLLGLTFCILFGILLNIFLIINNTFEYNNIEEISCSNQSLIKNINIDNLNNIEVLGQVLFNYYLIPFLMCGLVLLVALLGSVVLTFNFSVALIKKKSLYRQLSKKPFLRKADNIRSFHTGSVDSFYRKYYNLSYEGRYTVDFYQD